MPVDPPAPFHPLATRRVRETVRVGVGVIVVANNKNDQQEECKIYAGLRKGSHGDGTLALPGGHLELFETWHDCAMREVREEMDVELTDLQFAHVSNDIMEDEGKHYVTIFMMGRLLQDDDSLPQNMEPEKCAGWEAYTWQQLQEYSSNNTVEREVFGPLRRLLQDAPPAVLDYLKKDPASNNVVE
jgi:8-oxo-dGTP diphosphatase